MTYERKITVGLEDIKAVIFECKKCKSRLSVSPDSAMDIPLQCPQLGCKHQWRMPGTPTSESLQSPFSNFVNAVMTIRKWAKEHPEAAGFTVILEFDEAEMTKR